MPKLPGAATLPTYPLDQMLVDWFFCFVNGKHRCCVTGCGTVWDSSGDPRGGACVVLESDIDTQVGDICPRHLDELMTLKQTDRPEPEPRKPPEPSEREHWVAEVNNSLLTMVEALESKNLYVQELPADLVDRLLPYLRTGLPGPVADPYPGTAEYSREQFDAARQPGHKCNRCDYDRHECPGCGKPLPHGVEVCRECDRRVTLEQAAESATPPPGVDPDTPEARFGKALADWWTERAGAEWISRDWPMLIAERWLDVKRAVQGREEAP